MADLAKRTALVTGSTSGIGKEIARALATARCRIMIHGIDGDQALQTARQEMILAGATQVATGDHDLTGEDAAHELVSRTIEQLGSLDILVNNAGIQHVAPVEAFENRHWNRIIDLNLSAPFRLIRHALPVMRNGGFGRIVNIASVHGLVASTHKSAYVAAKHGLVGLTKTVALETAGQGITCNAICPGYVRTALLETQIINHAAEENLDMEDAARSFLGAKQPSGEFVSADQIGGLVSFLCSDAAAQVTGIAIPVDGGWTAQ